MPCPTRKPDHPGDERRRHVHFARFVFLDHTRLAVITTFDGDLTTYLEDFAAKIGASSTC